MQCRRVWLHHALSGTLLRSRSLAYQILGLFEVQSLAAVYVNLSKNVIDFLLDQVSKNIDLTDLTVLALGPCTSCLHQSIQLLVAGFEAALESVQFHLQLRTTSSLAKVESKYLPALTFAERAQQRLLSIMFPIARSCFNPTLYLAVSRIMPRPI